MGSLCITNAIIVVSSKLNGVFIIIDDSLVWEEVINGFEPGIYIFTGVLYEA